MLSSRYEEGTSTGTLALLQAARERGVEKFIYSSSVVGEQYCTLFADLAAMRIASLRYFNVYGERQLTEGAYALVIGKFLRQREEGEPLTVYGDGDQTRAYTHVSDVVRANLLALDSDKLPVGDNTVQCHGLKNQAGGTGEGAIPGVSGQERSSAAAIDQG